VDDNITQPDPEDPGKVIAFKRGDRIELSDSMADYLLGEEMVKYVGKKQRKAPAKKAEA
jgi:hypothetical protein